MTAEWYVTPSTLCTCGHYLTQHAARNASGDQVWCLVDTCRCRAVQIVSDESGLT